MARSKRRARDLPDVDDILAARVVPSLVELFALIVSVNPTDRDLAPDETARRYARKSKLQSLLIRRHAADLDMVRDGPDPGVVLLRHATHDRTACHAVLTELDDDARRLVQRLLDEALTDPAVAVVERPTDRVRSTHRAAARAIPTVDDGPPDTANDDPDRLVAAGREHLAAFDAVAARDAFERAVSLSNGAPGPVGELAVVLVDHLYDYPAAVALFDRIRPAVLDDDALRGAFAVALAHDGPEAGALALLATERVDPSRAAFAYAALAERARRAQRLHDADRFLERARRADPAQPQIRAVERAVELAWGARLAPLEAAIERLLAAGDLAGAAEQARAVMADRPDNPIARRTLRAAALHAHATKQRRLADAGDHARDCGDWDAAVDAYRAALAIGDDPSLAARLAAAESRARDDARARAVQALTDELADANLLVGLTSYAAAPADIRQVVRAALSRPELAWIDAMESVRPADAVAAAVALGQAHALLLSGRPEDALSAIAPHERTLRGVADAAAVFVAARQAIREAASRHARESLEEAEAAAGRADWDAALTTLSAIPVEALAEGDRAAAASLAQRVQEGRAGAELADRYQRAWDDGDLFRARDVARTGPSATDPAWTRRLASADAAIEASWVTVEVDPAGDDARDFCMFDTDRSQVHVALSDAGDDVLLVESIGARLFLRTMAMGFCRVRRSGWICTPHSLGPVHDIRRDGLSTWVATGAGDLIEIDSVTWRVLGHWHVRHFVEHPRVGKPGRVWALGGRRAWVSWSRPTGSIDVYGIDLERDRSHHVPGAPEGIFPCDGLAPPFLAGNALQERMQGWEVRVLDPSGRRLDVIPRSIAPHFATAATALPWAPGVLMAYPQRTKSGDSGPVHLTAIRFAHRPTRGWPTMTLHETNATADPHALATSTEHALAFAAVKNTVHGAVVVIAVGWNDTWHYPYQFSALTEARLVRDTKSCRVATIMEAPEGGLEITLLGASPPTFESDVSPWRLEGARNLGDPIGSPPPPAPPWRGGFLPRTGVRCDRWSAGRRTREVLAHHTRLAQMSESETAALVAATCDDGDFDSRLYLARALLEGGPHHEALAREVLVELIVEQPRHTIVAIELAQLEREAWRWEEVKSLLEPIQIAGPIATIAAHHSHLLGMTLVRLGDPDAARACWQRGLALDPEDQCGLGALVDMCRPDSAPTAALASQLAAAARDADALMGSGDPAAHRPVDIACVWRSGEMQCGARLAAAMLAAMPGVDVHPLRRERALATFAGRRSLLGLELPIVGAWDEARLADLERRCREALGCSSLPSMVK